MKRPSIIMLVAAALLLLAGCETRSISNSGYPGGYRYGPAGNYAGELSEFDVLGVESSNAITTADIAAALNNKTPVRISRGSKLLLIQSGADFPDYPLQAALEPRFSIGPFSGRPQAKNPALASSYSKSLRLAAAQGGYDKILCYWGVLESQSTDQITKTVSWVPIAGYFVPDESQSMRIRLKAVLIDTATGNWVMLQPDPVTDQQLSSVVSRRKNDQVLVTRLKEQGYQSLARLLGTSYAE